MGTIRINGAIDRNDPDPQAPGDPLSAWVGNLTAEWTDDGPRRGTAALIKVCTGRGIGDLSWGQHTLQLRWIGDPPPAEVARSVYDFVYDGGPARRPFTRVVESQPRSEAQASYRVQRARAS